MEFIFFKLYDSSHVRLTSLTYEGVTHSGFVQTDDNGDQYFFYPALTPVYKVMGGVANLFGVKDAFQIPMPVEFGAKLKMITPSLNPDSLFPTFAGPIASFPLKMLGNIVPQIKDLEQYLLGPYGEDQPMISAVLPSHLNRALATLNRDERNSQYASAFRKSATYLEAAGHGLKPVFNEATGQFEAPSAGRGYPCNTTSAAFTVTLPATPSAGDEVIILDYAGTFDTNKLTISPNGNKIEGSTDNVLLTGEKYYPVITEKNKELYKKYREIQNDKVTFIGRCGLYTYMDVIALF